MKLWRRYLNHRAKATTAHVSNFKGQHSRDFGPSDGQAPALRTLLNWRLLTIAY